RRPEFSVMIGVLEVLKVVQIWRGCSVRMCFLPRQFRQRVHVGMLCLDSPLTRRRDFFWGVERADRQRNSLWCLEGERGSAFGAKAALNIIGGLKPLRLPACPVER